MYTLIVTEMLEDWEDSVNIGMALVLTHYKEQDLECVLNTTTQVVQIFLPLVF